MRLWIVLAVAGILSSCVGNKVESAKINMDAYLAASDSVLIYPTTAQINMLKKVVPETAYLPAPPISNRLYWDSIASIESGKVFLDKAAAELGKAPEIPISDEIYRRANREGNRGIYKPRYYRTMDRLEKYIVGECIENKGRFIPQIEVYADSIMAMKSWMHPNHDDRENSVLKGKRVAIDLGARKFGLVLALADALLKEKLPVALTTKIEKQLQWRITDSYFKSCKGEDKVGNSWIKSTSNWNAVCTSGSVFTTIVASKNYDQRIAAIGCALNSMVYYVSGFGDDGYCSEGTGYWNYGFGHYEYLAEILADYSNGKINLFKFNNPEKLKKVGNFPENFQIHPGMYAPFADGVTTIKPGNDNFAYVMAAKHYGAWKPAEFVPNEAVQTLIIWKDGTDYTAPAATTKQLPGHTYFDDFGIVISRGKQKVPFSIAIKAGNNGENHNHMDVGSYVMVLGEDYMDGDIGAPSYIAGAFSPDNPARSSWGHPVPRIENTLQSNGKKFHGKIIEAEFTEASDNVVMDIKPAYEIPQLESLVRTMVNNKTGNGTITITDEFQTTEPVSFGTAITTFSKITMLDKHSFILTGVQYGQKVKVEVKSNDGNLKIKPERVPVEHLRSGKNAMRIGIDFTGKLKKGEIVMIFSPIPVKN